MMLPSGTTAEFGIAYEGEALSQNTMDVRDLAPALLALGELFTRANTLLNGEHTSVSLQVRATQPGSFDILLLLKQTYSGATQFLTSNLVTSAVNLKDLITGVPSAGGEALFSLIKKLKGRKPTEVETLPNGVTLKVHTPDLNLDLFVPTEVYRLHRDDEVTRLTQAVVAPLFRQGIDTMVIKEGNRQIESISKDDAPSFIASTISDASLTENILPNLALRIVHPALDMRLNKWRLDDGAGSKWYEIIDDFFLREMRERRRRFGMGDYLICRVKTVQRVTDKGLAVERTILQVLEHRQGGEQLSLTP